MDVKGELNLVERKMLVNNALNTEQQDAEDMLRRIRNRYDACVATSLSTAHCVHVGVRRFKLNFYSVNEGASTVLLNC